MRKTFVGFGFGPIQSALFLLEAQRSGNFARSVISEVDQALVEAIRRHDGRCVINIARLDHIDQCELSGIELLNPREPNDRAAIVTAISQSDEMATALPSVNIYDAGRDASVVRLLKDGLARRRQPQSTVIYAAENHNEAAQILRCRLEEVGAPQLDSVQVLDTVIGKMSGVITDAATIERLGLRTLTPDLPRAILVEEFHRILVSRIELCGYQRGIEVFIDKTDLLPFEDAKLYGHNAIHALIAYLADLKGLSTIAAAGHDQDIMQAARAAFIDESGAALVARYQHLGDALFTPAGYAAYADDLLQRMVNPHLNDLVERVGRDHARKLGSDDRLYGTMRLALDAGIRPSHLALGAAAGVVSMIKRGGTDPSSALLPQRVDELDQNALCDLLHHLWQGHSVRHAGTLMALTWEALQKLHEPPWA